MTASRTPPSRLPRTSREIGEIVHDPALLASMQRRDQRRERELVGDHSAPAAPSAGAASAAAAFAGCGGGGGGGGGGGTPLLPRIGAGAATAQGGGGGGGGDALPVPAAARARQRRASHEGVVAGALWRSPMAGGAAAAAGAPRARAELDALLQAAEERLKQAAAEQQEADCGAAKIRPR